LTFKISNRTAGEGRRRVEAVSRRRFINRHVPAGYRFRIALQRELRIKLDGRAGR
jgi:hypothetical protein